MTKPTTSAILTPSPAFAATSTVDSCRLIDLPRIDRQQGNISLVESGKHVPFELARVYYLYDVPGGHERGGHAHRLLEQLIISCLGAFDVILDDGYRRRTVTLNRSYFGLYVCPGIWREIVNFSSGAICLVLASRRYDEADYIRDYEEFSRFKAPAPATGR